MEIKSAGNLEHARIDRSQFGPRNQELWLKWNFLEMTKMMIFEPKWQNIAKKRYATIAKLLTIDGHAEMH